MLLGKFSKADGFRAVVLAGWIVRFQDTGETAGAKALWENLPSRVLVSTTETVEEEEVTTSAWYDVSYSAKETKINYTAASKKDAEPLVTPIEADENKIITNTPTTSIHVSKEWQNKDGEKLAGEDIPTDAEVTFTLLANSEVLSPTRTVVVNGVDETKNAATGDDVTPTTDDYEGSDWTAYFTNLPTYIGAILSGPAGAILTIRQRKRRQTA